MEFRECANIVEASRGCFCGRMNLWRCNVGMNYMRPDGPGTFCGAFDVRWGRCFQGSMKRAMETAENALRDFVQCPGILNDGQENTK